MREGSRIKPDVANIDAELQTNTATDSSAPASGKATCPLCPRNCQLTDGSRGWCGARIAQNGMVAPESYGRISSLSLDPIEKKPLAFFHPGSMILSIGGYGCNLDCPFCQNSSIAHGWTDARTDARTVARTDARIKHSTEAQKASLECGSEVFSATKLVQLALRDRVRGNIGIAYTYNEPLIMYEFVYDCASQTHKAGLLNVIVTNGYFNEKPWDELLFYIDAANIDLKGFTQGFYDRLSAPKGLKTVKRNIEQAAQRIHVEITTLIVPGLNDSAEEINELASWIASIDKRIPLHLTRFFPCHRMSDSLPTPIATLHALAKVAQQHLEHVCLGNI